MGTTPYSRAPEYLRERVRRAIETTPAATVRTRTRVLVALAVVPALTAIVAAIASGLVHGRPAAGLAVDVASGTGALTVFALLAGLALASTAFALRQGRGGLGIGSAWLVSIAALVVPVYAALTILQPLHSGAADHAIYPAISTWGWRCMLLAAIVGSSALAIFAAALRRAVAVASGLRGAALGAAAGAWGGLAVFAFCPSGELQHLLAGHVMPIAAFIFIGGLVLTRALRP
jgi:hypothetical protein